MQTEQNAANVAMESLAKPLLASNAHKERVDAAVAVVNEQVLALGTPLLQRNGQRHVAHRVQMAVDGEGEDENEESGKRKLHGKGGEEWS